MNLLSYLFSFFSKEQPVDTTGANFVLVENPEPEPELVPQEPVVVKVPEQRTRDSESSEVDQKIVNRKNYNKNQKKRKKRRAKI